tara:strand:- start:23 stop:664 length:642 start_codon:yes stop_codon:yes gene_type:complete
LNNFIISIDGPAGSGKERIAKYIAKKYKLYHLDSGILYRRLAYFLIKNKIDINNENELKKFVKSLNELSPRNHFVLRKELISKTSSQIAVLPYVRKFINRQQKKIISEKIKKFKGCVIDGRDIGSKVFKEAKIKLFINVSIDIRAKRRHKQLIALGEKSIYAQILEEIKLRDRLDKNRKNSPLVKPVRAIVIDNSKNFDNTKKQILKIFNNFK